MINKFTINALCNRFIPASVCPERGKTALIRSMVLLVMFIFSTGFPGSIAAQSPPYPGQYASPPLEIPMLLSGTFGELRSDHFHSGIDIKTQQREGLPVRVPADGYVSRIKISHWGYGKAVYITHPDGYTTVYGHLSRFNKTLENYIKKKQYEKKSFVIQLFPGAGQFPVKKGEIIAYTGSTGGFVGPHLHYEIRKTDGAIPTNPLLFGLNIPDHIKPTIQSLYAYALQPGSQVNSSEVPISIPITRISKGLYKAEEIFAEGTIGFGIETFDLLDGAPNHNGIYSMEMKVNGRTAYAMKMEDFSFENTRDINLHTDYKIYTNKRKWIRKCFIEPGDRLRIYDRQYPGAGYIDLADGDNVQVEIIVSDVAGNTSILIVPVKGKKLPIVLKKEVKTTDYPIIASAFNKFTIAPVTVAFPKNTFYQDLYLDFKLLDDGSVQVHSPDVPLRKKFTITFDTRSFLPEDRKHLFLARYNRHGKPKYVPFKRKEEKIFATTRKLGRYRLISDYKPPTVKPYNFYDGKWMSKEKYLKVKISDELSGIESYSADIDGQWARMEWDLKKGLLVYDFDDLPLTGAKHLLTLKVTDHANNTKILKVTFYRK